MVISANNINTTFSKEQEQLFKLTFENAAVGIAQINAAGKFLRVNTKLAQITGYSKDELLQKTFQEITHPDDLEADLKQAEALYRGEIDSYSMEKRYFKKDGTIVWIKLTGSAIFGEDGGLNVFIAIIEDISKRKKAEAAFREKQEQLTNTLNSITDCYLALDREYKILAVNETAEKKIFNRPAGELEGKVIWELYPDGKGDIFHREYERAFKENNSVHFEARSNVSEKWLEVHAYPRDNFLEVFFRDITLRKNMEDSLRKSETKFSKLFFSSPGFTFINSLENGDFIEVNDSYCRLTGYTRQELIGKNSGDLGILTKEQRDAIVGEILKHGKVELSEAQITDRHGIIHTVLHSAEIISINGDTYILSSGIDISQHKQAEEALRESEKRFKVAAAAAKIGTYTRNLVSGEDIWSPEFLALYGYNPGDSLPLKDGIPAAVHPDDRQRVIAEAHERLKQTITPDFNSEHRIILPNGEFRWINIQGKTEFDRRNYPIRSYGIAMDITSRKEAELALRKSEEKYRALFESIDEGFCICEMLVDEEGKPYDYRWLEINPTWGHQTGLKDPIGRTALELVPNLEQHWIDTYGKVALTGEPVRFQQESKAMGRWFDVYAFPVGEPHLRHFGILFSDITSRKQSEEALRQKVEENEKMMDIMPAAVFISEDSRCDNIRGNRMANQFYEAEPEENVSANVNSGRRFFRNGTELLPADLHMQKAARENRQVLNEALDVLLPGGKWLHMHGSAVPLNDESGNVRGAIAAFVDITQRMEAENALRDSEEKFRLMANNISQLAWMADNQGRIFWFNERWLNYTGTTLEEVQGWGWQKCHHPEHINRVLEKRKQAWEAGQPWEDTFPLRGKDGQYRWYLSRAIPLHNKNGKATLWFGTNTDITNQQEYESLLKRNNDLFENLLYITAHDLKGPVANMYMALNLFRNAPDTKKVEIFGQFRPLVDRLDKTIKGVTDILKVQKADETVARNMHFESVLNDILIEFKDKLEAGALNYSFSSRETIRYIGPFLYSIMKNLISNAIKYRKDSLPLSIEIETQQKDSYCLLTVKDNGIGIDLDKFGKQLFSPFQRFTPSKAKGTGVGLYIIKNIIEKNGGYIRLESKPGEGSVFYCYLKAY